MSFKVEAVSEPLILGEGPHWNAIAKVLNFVDIANGKIHSYDPQTGKQVSAVIDKGDVPVSMIVPISGTGGQRFVVSKKNDIFAVNWDGKRSEIQGEPELIAHIEQSDNTHRLNDGKVDPKGRLWAGTMGSQIEINGSKTYEPNVGALYMLIKDGSIKKQIENVTISNGLVWSLDKTKMYYIDSLSYTVDVYDYDNESGNLSETKNVIFDFKKNDIPGFPDGMTIDSEGNLYVANYGGGQVLKINPLTGELLLKIPIPTPEVTSVAFGGDQLDELYVTTADKKKLILDDKNAGRLFRVTDLGVKGVPMMELDL